MARARVVVNVDSLMPYTTKGWNVIVVTLGQQPAPTVGQGRRCARPPRGSSGAPVERAIRTIDFRRVRMPPPRDRAAHDPRHAVNVRQEGQQSSVDFAGTAIPKNLMRRYESWISRLPGANRGRGPLWKAARAW